MTRYRDKETGRFVGKSTWNRSKAHGGTRYVREKTKAKIEEREFEPEEVSEEEFEEGDYEYEGAFDSP